MELTEERLVEILDRKLDERFAQQQTWLEAKFEEERAYYQQLLRQELQSVNTRLDRLETKINQVLIAEGEDIQAVTRRLKIIKSQVKALEAQVAELQAA